MLYPIAADSQVVAHLTYLTALRELETVPLTAVEVAALVDALASVWPRPDYEQRPAIWAPAWARGLLQTLGHVEEIACSGQGMGLESSNGGGELVEMAGETRCQSCGEVLTSPLRRDARYCSSSCRWRAKRSRSHKRRVEAEREVSA